MAFSVYAGGSLLYSSTDLGENKIINPKLKVEINKAGSFTFSMLPNHTMYDSLNPMKTLITVEQDGLLLFRGRVIECKSDFYKQKNVTCEGDLAFLLDSVTSPFRYVNPNGKTIREIFKKIVDEHNSQVETWKRFSYSDNYITVTKDDESSVSATDEFDHTSYSDTSSTLTQELLDAYGGILRTRTVGNTTYLDYIKDPSQDISGYGINSQKIEFAVNLLDIDQSYPVSDIFTVLLPIGGDKITIESVNNGSKYLENQDAIAKFGRIIKVEQWSDERDKNKLKKKAKEYLKVHSKVFSNDINVKAIDLHYLDSNKTQLKLGDRVQCISGPHDIDVTLVCLSIEYDLQNPENNSYKLGTYIRSDKHKGKISKSSSKNGGGGSRRRTGSSSTPLSSMAASTTTEVEEAKEEESTGFWTNLKNLGRLMAGELQEDASHAIDALGIDDLIDGAKNLVFPDHQIKDKEGNPMTDDQGNPITETVKDLMHIDNDIYNIKADVVRIDADIVEINARKISIGDDNTETIDMDAEFINITGLVKSLLVHELTADNITSMTIGTTGTIATKGLRIGNPNDVTNVSGYAKVPTLTPSIQANDRTHAVNVQTLLDILQGNSSAQSFNSSRYANSTDLATGYILNNRTTFFSATLDDLKANRIRIRNDQGTTVTYEDVATQDWVIHQINGGMLKGYFNTLFVKVSGQEKEVATKNWVDTNFVKPSDLTSYATQSWVNNQGYATIYDADSRRYVNSLRYRTQWLLGQDGGTYEAYVVG